MATASGGADSEHDHGLYTDDEQQPLGEFVCTHTLPAEVAVTRGSFLSSDAMIARGDVLLLRGLSTATITLSFSDLGSEKKKQFVVSPDLPVKFLVLPTRGADREPDLRAEIDEEGLAKNEGARAKPYSTLSYATVEELLNDCPTYFEANSAYDDPYLPGFSVKPGDRFHFVKVVRDVGGERQERLQCRTENGELVYLSLRCQGNFTVLKDKIAYTVRELIEQAKVMRRLKLASQEQISKAEQINTEMLGGILPSFKGTIIMSKPEEIVEASPWDGPETVWCIPLDANLYVRPYSSNDYEEPVSNRKIKPESLVAFANEHEHKFPVQAVLFSYRAAPKRILRSLEDSKDIIVHEQLQTSKLFVKDSKTDEFFAIDETVDISFVQIPRSMSSIFEMMSLRLGTEVQVLADVAADFPVPFVLRYGDILRVTKQVSSSWKFKHSSTGDVPIVKCERVLKGGKTQKLKVPLDLQVSLVVITDPAQLKVTRLADILSGEDDAPPGDVSVLEGNGGSYPPLPSSLQLLHVLADPELLISPVSSTSAICPRIKTCARIPVRHHAKLGFRRKLEFPDGYFILPSRGRTAAVGIEKVLETEYEELLQAEKKASEYEDVEFSKTRAHHAYHSARENRTSNHGGHRQSHQTARKVRDDDTRSQASSVARSRSSEPEDTNLTRSTSSGSLERNKYKEHVKRISKVLNPKNWKQHLQHLQRGSSNPPELPPPDVPVAGILTLSLQPQQSRPNEYVAEELSSPTIKAPKETFGNTASSDYEEDFSPYEDVNISHGHHTKSSPFSKSQTMPSFPETPAEKPAVSKASSSEDLQGQMTFSHHREGLMQMSTSKGVEADRPRQRQAKERREQESKDSSARGDKQRRKRNEPSDKIVKHSDDRKTLDASARQESEKEADLERAPPVRHRRAKGPQVSSPELEKIRKSMPLHDAPPLPLPIPDNGWPKVSNGDGTNTVKAQVKQSEDDLNSTGARKLEKGNATSRISPRPPARQKASQHFNENGEKLSNSEQQNITNMTAFDALRSGTPDLPQSLQKVFKHIKEEEKQTIASVTDLISFADEDKKGIDLITFDVGPQAPKQESPDPTQRMILPVQAQSSVSSELESLEEYAQVKKPKQPVPAARQQPRSCSPQLQQENLDTGTCLSTDIASGKQDAFDFMPDNQTRTDSAESSRASSENTTQKESLSKAPRFAARRTQMPSGSSEKQSALVKLKEQIPNQKPLSTETDLLDDSPRRRRRPQNLGPSVEPFAKRLPAAKETFFLGPNEIEGSPRRRRRKRNQNVDDTSDTCSMTSCSTLDEKSETLLLNISNISTSQTENVLPKCERVAREKPPLPPKPVKSPSADNLRSKDRVQNSDCSTTHSLPVQQTPMSESPAALPQKPTTTLASAKPITPASLSRPVPPPSSLKPASGSSTASHVPQTPTPASRSSLPPSPSKAALPPSKPIPPPSSSKPQAVSETVAAPPAQQSHPVAPPRKKDRSKVGAEDLEISKDGWFMGTSV